MELSFMLVIKILAFLIGTLALGLTLAGLAYWVTLKILDIPLNGWGGLNMRSAIIQNGLTKYKNQSLGEAMVMERVLNTTLILGFLAAGLLMFVGLFTEYSLTGMWGNLKNKFIDASSLNFGIAISPAASLLMGVLAGTFWGFQWGRYIAAKRALSSPKNDEERERFYKSIRITWRRTSIASAFVLFAIVPIIFFPLSPGSWFLLFMFLGLSTVYTEPDYVVIRA